MDKVYKMDIKDPHIKVEVLKNKEYKKVFPNLQDFVETTQPASDQASKKACRSISSQQVIDQAIKRRRSELLDRGIGLQFRGFPDYVNFFPIPDVQVVGVDDVLPGDIVNVATDRVPVSEVFYFRPLGAYATTGAEHYVYTDAFRRRDQETCYRAAKVYTQALQAGSPPEIAQLILPRNLRAVFWLLGPYGAILNCLCDQAMKHSMTDYENRLLGHLGLQALDAQNPEFFLWASDYFKLPTRSGLGLFSPTETLFT